MELLGDGGADVLELVEDCWRFLDDGVVHVAVAGVLWAGFVA